MAEENLKRKILLDEPVSEDKFSGGGHSRTAKALAHAIIEFKDKDRAIGIDGSWGSGKSSIIDMAKDELESKASEGEAINYHFCTFDVWKSQGAAFRRTFLEYFLCWAKEKFPKQHSQLEKIEKEISGKKRDVTTNKNPILDLYGFLILFALPFLPFFYFWGRSVYIEYEKLEGNFLFSLPMWVLYIFIIITLISALIKKCKFNKSVINDQKKISYGMALSRTLLIASKQYADQEITEHIRETDPNDFEFQNTLHKILKLIQDDTNRVVLVLDNIDRIPSDELSEYWSIARSIFARNSFSKELTKNADKKTAITVIMPFDRNHVDGSKTEDYEPPEKEELFSKTFNEILFVSPPVMSSAKEFFYEKIAEALPSLSEQEDVYGVYLALNAYLEQTGGKFTPRRIITFINELSSIYCMHKGEIPIVTVACYIAQREDIEQEPRILIGLKSQRDNLHSKLYKIAKDKDHYEKHLAAIFFNVDSKLAFQLLLDDKLAKAASSNNSEELIKLSESPGFETRIHGVVENKTSDWIVQEELDQVAINFKILFEKYDGGATTYIKNELIDALALSSILIDVYDKDRNYLAFIDICPEDQLESLTTNILKKSLKPFLNKEQAGFDDGEAFMLYVGNLKDTLNSRNADIDVQELLNNFDMPEETSSYALGMASVCKQVGVHISELNHIHIDLSSEDNDLIEHMRGNPTNCEDIFEELMRDKDLVTDDDWVKIANAVIDKLAQGKCDDVDNFEAFINICSQIYLHVERKVKEKINLQKLFSEGNFYKLLDDFYAEDANYDIIPKLIFLTRQNSISSQLPKINQQNKNNQPANQVRGHGWLQKLNNNELTLTSDKHVLIGDNVRKALKVHAWIEHGSQNSDPLVDLVIKETLTNEPVPRIPLTTILKEYEYLKRTLNNEFGVFLQNYAQCIDKDALEKVELTEVPVGLLTDSKAYLADGWDAFHTLIEEEYSKMPLSEWDSTLTKAEDALELFFEIIDISNFQINTDDYKTALQRFIIQELQTPTDTYVEDVDYDDLFNAIPEKARGDWCRTLHENLTNVSQKGLIETEQLAQQTVKQILVQKPTTAQEKDNYVRHLMCNALEASEARLINCLRSFKREDIRSIIKDCEDSTEQLLEQSLRQFMTSDLDDDTKKKLRERIEGRKPKKYLEETYPSVYKSVKKELKEK